MFVNKVLFSVQDSFFFQDVHSWASLVEFLTWLTFLDDNLCWR
jgi:hypothetical protein